MEGILAIWKEEGWTSHDVVAKTRGILKVKRIGHAGTLDPMVTGVLPLCIGRSTRVVEYLQERPKAYEATITLGIATDTEDITGDVIERADASHISIEQVKEALQSFLGDIMQVPPMFSAVKINGQRLYDLAREGKTVERQARPVTIHTINLIEAQLQNEQPTFRFHVECSKGTYIRTLCVDIGKVLGVPATMSSLVRTMSGGITKEQCLSLEQVKQLMEEQQLANYLLPAEVAINHLPKLIVKTNKIRFALQGQKLYWSDCSGHEHLLVDEIVRIYDEEHNFVGIFKLDQKNKLIVPIKVFS